MGARRRGLSVRVWPYDISSARMRVGTLLRRNFKCRVFFTSESSLPHQRRSSKNRFCTLGDSLYPCWYYKDCRLAHNPNRSFYARLRPLERFHRCCP